MIRSLNLLRRDQRRLEKAPDGMIKPAPPKYSIPPDVPRRRGTSGEFRARRKVAGAHQILLGEGGNNLRKPRTPHRKSRPFPAIYLLRRTIIGHGRGGGALRKMLDLRGRVMRVIKNTHAGEEATTLEGNLARALRLVPFTSGGIPGTRNRKTP